MGYFIFLPMFLSQKGKGEITSGRVKDADHLAIRNQMLEDFREETQLQPTIVGFNRDLSWAIPA